MANKCLYSPGMSLGENVKFLREARGLTYDAVGKAVGTDGQNIFNLEKRKSKVSKFASKLAKYFEVDLDDLTEKDLSKEPWPPEVAPAQLSLVRQDSQQYGNTPQIDRLIELAILFEQSSEDGREFIMSSARSAEKATGARWKKVGNKS